MAVGLFVTAELSASQTDETYTIPSKTEQIKFVARGGTVSFYDAVSGTAFTLEANESLSLRGQNLGGEEIVYTTPGGVTVEIFVQKFAA